MAPADKKKHLLTREQLQYSQATLTALGTFDVETWTDNSISMVAHSTSAPL